uniref:Peptidoglycan recognition protein n=1 Tax=Leguminivora glycinivorella TaxID=1035111 RepID=A0A346RAC8_9NEOP|nr:peptidoglycan recognition protein LB [Leguminivora glycinivorella]
MSDAYESDCEELPVKTVKKKNRMRILVAVLLIGLIGVAVAIPTVMLTRKSSTSDPSENEVVTFDFPYVTRSEWGARPPVETLPLRTPVPYVVIHHSHTPKACYNRQDCIQAMKSMQNFHIDDRHWWDIAYHFGVGSDGVAYEGRGWPILGAHALHFNNISIGICVIGDWSNSTPPAEQIKTVKSLIAAGVDLGYIQPNYKLLGHRQVRDTECPGQTFFDAVKAWDHWSAFPASHEDLVNVPELSEEFREEYNKTLNAV